MRGGLGLPCKPAVCQYFGGSDLVFVAGRERPRARRGTAATESSKCVASSDTSVPVKPAR